MKSKPTTSCQPVVRVLAGATTPDSPEIYSISKDAENGIKLADFHPYKTSVASDGLGSDISALVEVAALWQ